MRYVPLALVWGCTADKADIASSRDSAAPGVDVRPLLSDLDGDGVDNSWDCAPNDPDIYPGALELCNGIDDNCDGRLEPDDDGDGVTWCDDCDDANSDIYPGADDLDGDMLDTNCDGTDGVGIALSMPVRVGEMLRRTAGFALAGGDVDGDGCAELLIGEPGAWAGYPPQEDAAVLQMGCRSWSEDPQSLPGTGTSMGWSVELAPGLVIVHELLWQGSWGRVLVFDETFGPDAVPLLEVRGSGTAHHGIDAMAVLGEPPQWLLLGEQGSLDFTAEFHLLDIHRTGLFDFEFDEADLHLETNTHDVNIGTFLGDVGDRDGDGEVDLGIDGEEGERPVRFFPQAAGGHVDDAPEVWNDLDPGTIINQRLRSGGDLDADGRSEAIYASLFADGEEASSGRAFLLPWLGSGEFDVDIHAPTRIDGEFYYDRLGEDSTIDDIDGDGYNDLLISAPGEWWFSDPRPGKIMLFVGPIVPGVLTIDDAALVYTGEQWEDNAGISLATGDFDGSGHTDIAIGAPFADRDDITQAGAVYVLTDPL